MAIKCPLGVYLLRKILQKALLLPSYHFGGCSSENQIFISGNDINIMLILANLTVSATTVSGVELRLVQFAAFNGTIPNAFTGCDMRTYSVAGGIKKSRSLCSDGLPHCHVWLPVTLATVMQSGTTIPLQLGLTADGQAPAGQISVAPHETSQGSPTALDIDIAPQLSGTYQSQVGLNLQNGNLQYFDPVMTALAGTPSAIITHWSADNCSLPKNSSLIPTTGSFLCPGPVNTE